MAYSKIGKRFFGPVTTVLLITAVVASLALLSAAARQSSPFADYFSQLLVVNIVCAAILSIWILANLWRLRRRIRRRSTGSRLTLRLLIMFVVIAILPLSGIYYFSLRLINEDIDSWFDVQISDSLDDALKLGQISVEAIKKDLIEQTQKSAGSLSEAQSELMLIQMVDDIRARTNISELSLYSYNGRIIASSSIESGSLIPDRPDDAIIQRIRHGGIHTSLEPAPADGLHLRVVVPVISSSVQTPNNVLQSIQLLPLRYSKLGLSIETASREYERLVYLRQPLKFSFVLTLTLITLVTALIAVWLAMFLSHRLVLPLRELATGTRAVAAGDYQKKLQVTSEDDFGVLVRSFNEMTEKIQQAQEQASESQMETEEQRTYLETVLAHLSSGVLSFDFRNNLKTSNATAKQILGVDFDAERNVHIAELLIRHPHIKPFLKIIHEAMLTGKEWQAEVVMNRQGQRKILMCQGSRLPVDSRDRNGCVIVFDDITELLQAQRDAAWGEVARRLAHEIKNPLTPIQLSAERIRHKYLVTLPEAERDTLDRATRTIVQQVESMKSMVNAFSSYAQPVTMDAVLLDLRKLILDVLELHKDTDKPLKFNLNVDDDLPLLNADPIRMRQVFNNLVLNTKDAMTDGGEPTLAIRASFHPNSKDSYIEITLQDNGPGFPEHLKNRIFEPYITTKERGTGLGLAIVKKIIEEHRGSLLAENIEGGGAKVILRLPVEYNPANLTDPGIRLQRV